MKKKALRNQYKLKRESTGSAELLKKETKILELLLEFSALSRIGYLHHFIPIPEEKEFDAPGLAERLRKSNPDLKAVVPRVVQKSRDLEHVMHENDTHLTESEWGIREPVGGTVVDVKLIDAVIVPLLCFDIRGHRVGYGAGYYDRFLAKCRPDCLKIGVSYFAPVDRIDDIHDGDTALDYCVTPERIFDFSDESGR